jgi:DNA-binding PadR family transcriptional regulator
MEERGYLSSSEEAGGRQSRRVYRATPEGRKAMAAAKLKVRELFSELFEDEPSENGLPRGPAARDLMNSLVIELRASAGEAQDPETQALLETSAAVIGGLIKAFDDYERRSEKEQ